MSEGLTGRLLALKREVERALAPRRVPAASILRGRKAAEFSANLAAALRFPTSELHRIREFFPFFHFSLLDARTRNALPRRLRDSLDDIVSEGVVRGRSERDIWCHILKLAHRLYSRIDRGTPLPYPSVQVVTDSSGRASLYTLTRSISRRLERLIPNALSSCGVSMTRPHFPKPSDRVLLLAHFDLHGFAMLMATYLGLRQAGVRTIDYIFDYNSTGDYGKFWKRTLPRAAADGYDHIITLDLTVYWVRPERTLKGLHRAADEGARLTVVDHHLDTLFFVDDIVMAGAELVLTDVPGCFLGARIGRRELPYSWLGALGDRDLLLRYHAHTEPDSIPSRRDLPLVLGNLKYLMQSLSPPPKEVRKLRPFPSEELVQGAEQGIRGLKGALATVTGRGYRIELPQGEIVFQPPLADRDHDDVSPPETVLLGRVLLVTQALTLQGRGWYDLLDDALETEPSAIYALAGRYLPGAGFNFLVVKRWRELAAPAPLSFVRAGLRAQSIGHFDAYWLNLRERAAEELVGLVRRMNAYYGTKGLRNRPIIERLLMRLVDARVNRAEQTGENGNQSE